MDKARLTMLLQNPHQITTDDAKAVKELKEEFPYFQALTPLLAIADKKFEPSANKHSLPTAAIYTLDRKHLKSLLQGTTTQASNSNTETGKYEQVATTPPHLQIKEDHLPDSFFNELFDEMESLKKSKEQFKRILEKLEQEVPKPVVKKPSRSTTSKKVPRTVSKKTVAKAKTKPKAKTTAIAKKSETALSKTKTLTPAPKKVVKKTAKKSQTEVENINAEISYDFINEIKLKEKKEINDQHKKEQIDLINNFIEKEPILTKKFIENDPDAKRVIEDLSVSSTSLSEDVISETLAKLMLKQGRNQKAIDIYKKLIWKFPQKKTYFAEQIEKLKREQ